MPLNSLLKLIDRYVRQVPIKGGFVWFNPDVIICTANAHPSTWYQFQPNEKFPLGRLDKERALRRRFTTVHAWDEHRQQFCEHDNPDAIKRYWPIGGEMVLQRFDRTGDVSDQLHDADPRPLPARRLLPEEIIGECLNLQVLDEDFDLLADSYGEDAQRF